MPKRKKKRVLDPFSVYVQDPEMSLPGLSRKIGVPLNTLKKISAREGWVERKKRFWDDVRRQATEDAARRISEEMGDAIVEATRRHRDEGKGLQTVGVKMLREADRLIKAAEEGWKCPECGKPVGLPKLKPGEALRAAVQSVKGGVEVERRALGLAETIVKIEFAREYGKVVVDIVGKYIDDPVVLRNIARDLDSFTAAEEEKLEQWSEHGKLLQ